MGNLSVTHIKLIPKYCLQQGVFPLKKAVQEQTGNSWRPKWQTIPVTKKKNYSKFQKAVVYPLPMERSLQRVCCLVENEMYGVLIKNTEEILWFGGGFFK